MNLLKLSKSKRVEKSYFVSAILLLPTLIVVFTGLVLIFSFHQHHPGSVAEFWGMGRLFWRDIHIYSSIVSTLILIYHFALITKNFFKVVLFKIKNGNSSILSCLYIVCAISGFVPYISGLIDESKLSKVFLIELHDKFGLLIIIFLIIHIAKKLKPLLKFFRNNSIKSKLAIAPKSK